jgi:hypothetical protein
LNSTAAFKIKTKFAWYWSYINNKQMKNIKYYTFGTVPWYNRKTVKNRGKNFMNILILRVTQFQVSWKGCKWKLLYEQENQTASLVATSADSVPSSYLVRFTISLIGIGTTLGNLQWRRY